MNARSSESRQTCLDGRVVTGKDKVNEANPCSPVYVADCVVSAFALGGCNDYAFLGTLPDSRVDGYT